MASSDSKVPVQHLPTCWSDDVRMNALFAPFRLKSANPESWQMKMKFWTDMLKQWCRHKGDPFISAHEAKIAFMRDGRTAACLDIVVEELLRNNELLPINKCTSALSASEEGWIHWTARLAIKPVAVAASAFTSLLPSRYAIDSDGLPKASVPATQRFVMYSALREQSLLFLREYPSDAEHCGTFDELMKSCNYPHTKRECFEIIMGYLLQEGLAMKKGDLFKISCTASKVAPITDCDETLHRLLATEKKLQLDIEKYHHDADRAVEDARISMSNGNKLAAKHHLRRKQRYLSRAQVCDSALENIRQLLHDIQHVDMNTEVVNTYRISADVLKRSMKAGGLSEDAAHATIDELNAALEEYNDIENAISSSNDEFDVEELEKELSDLMSGEGGGGKDEVAAKKPTGMVIQGVSERDYVFDGEARMIAELNDLGVEDRSPKQKEKVPVKPKVAESEWIVNNNDPKTSKDKIWSTPQIAKNVWQNTDTNFNYENTLSDSFSKLGTGDCRLHPGQPISPEAFYPSLHDDYIHVPNRYREISTSPKTPPSFQMAPGGERRKTAPQDDSISILEMRLKNLRN